MLEHLASSNFLSFFWHSGLISVQLHVCTSVWRFHASAPLFNYRPDSWVRLVTDINLSTPSSDITSVSWTGRTRSTKSWITPTRLIKVSKSTTCPQNVPGSDNETASQLQIYVSVPTFRVFFLKKVFLCLTLMYLFSRNLAGYERFRIWVGMVDNGWRSE